MKIEEYLIFKGSKDSFIQQYLTPVFYGGKVFPGYFVDKDGEIWSSKYTKMRILKWFYNKKAQYPRITLYFENNVIRPLVHRVVCETFHKVPLPEGVTEEEWKKTPESVKSNFYYYWEVHHKDHDKNNYHPSNLEWVSCKQNMEKYKTYLREQA